MQNYISVKMVKAEPCKAWKDFKGHKEGDEGYKIYYPDGYVSWCPKDIFEAQYLELEKEDTITQKDVDNFVAKTDLVETKEDEKVCFRLLVTCKNGLITDGNIRNYFILKDLTEEKIEYMKKRVLEDIKKEIKDYLGFLLQCAKNGFKYTEQKEENTMQLKDTVYLMLSDDYKKRLMAEYFQADIRAKKLSKILEKYKQQSLDFNPNCSFELLNKRFVNLKGYLETLKEEAEIIGINLEKSCLGVIK